MVTVVVRINDYKSPLEAEKCITSSAKSVQEQVQDKACTTPNKLKGSSGKYSRKLSYFCRFHYS